MLVIISTTVVWDIWLNICLNVQYARMHASNSMVCRYPHRMNHWHQFLLCPAWQFPIRQTVGSWVHIIACGFWDNSPTLTLGDLVITTIPWFLIFIDDEMICFMWSFLNHIWKHHKTFLIPHALLFPELFAFSVNSNIYSFVRVVQVECAHRLMQSVGARSSDVDLQGQTCVIYAAAAGSMQVGRCTRDE